MDESSSDPRIPTFAALMILEQVAADMAAELPGLLERFLTPPAAQSSSPSPRSDSGSSPHSESTFSSTAMGGRGDSSGNESARGLIGVLGRHLYERARHDLGSPDAPLRLWRELVQTLPNLPSLLQSLDLVLQWIGRLIYLYCIEPSWKMYLYPGTAGAAGGLVRAHDVTQLLSTVHALVSVLAALGRDLAREEADSLIPFLLDMVGHTGARSDQAILSLCLHLSQVYPVERIRRQIVVAIQQSHEMMCGEMGGSCCESNVLCPPARSAISRSAQLHLLARLIHCAGARAVLGTQSQTLKRIVQRLVVWSSTGRTGKGGSGPRSIARSQGSMVPETPHGPSPECVSVLAELAQQLGGVDAVLGSVTASTSRSTHAVVPSDELVRAVHAAVAMEQLGSTSPGGSDGGWSSPYGLDQAGLGTRGAGSRLASSMRGVGIRGGKPSRRRAAHGPRWGGTSNPSVSTELLQDVWPAGISPRKASFDSVLRMLQVGYAPSPQRVIALHCAIRWMTQALLASRAPLTGMLAPPLPLGTASAEGGDQTPLGWIAVQWEYEISQVFAAPPVHWEVSSGSARTWLRRRQERVRELVNAMLPLLRDVLELDPSAEGAQRYRSWRRRYPQPRGSGSGSGECGQIHTAEQARMYLALLNLVGVLLSQPNLVKLMGSLQIAFLARYLIQHMLHPHSESWGDAPEMAVPDGCAQPKAASGGKRTQTTETQLEVKGAGEGSTEQPPPLGFNQAILPALNAVMLQLLREAPYEKCLRGIIIGCLSEVHTTHRHEHLAPHEYEPGEYRTLFQGIVLKCASKLLRIMPAADPTDRKGALPAALLGIAAEFLQIHASKVDEVGAIVARYKSLFQAALELGIHPLIDTTCRIFPKAVAAQVAVVSSSDHPLAHAYLLVRVAKQLAALGISAQIPLIREVGQSSAGQGTGGPVRRASRLSMGRTAADPFLLQVHSQQEADPVSDIRLLNIFPIHLEQHQPPQTNLRTAQIRAR